MCGGSGVRGWGRRALHYCAHQRALEAADALNATTVIKGRDGGDDAYVESDKGGGP